MSDFDDDTDVVIMDFLPDFEREEPTRRLPTPTETMAQVQQTPPERGSVAMNVPRTETRPLGSRGRVVVRLG